MTDAIMKVSRVERRRLLAKEAHARKLGKWEPWEVLSFPKGSVSSDPFGWAYQFQTAHRNNVFCVLDRTVPVIGVRHLAVTSLSGIRPTWPGMQRIKDEIVGAAATAVEVYPPRDEIIDQADMYHIWVLPGPLAFSLFERRAAA